MGDHPVEMGMAGQEAELTRRLSADACYRTLFMPAPSQETKGAITVASTSKALAAFERTLISSTPPMTRATRGDRQPLSDQAAGQPNPVLQGDKGCAGCHAGPNFTDGQFHAHPAPRAPPTTA